MSARRRAKEKKELTKKEKRAQNLTFAFVVVLLILIFAAIVYSAVYGLNFVNNAFSCASAIKEDASYVLSCVLDRDVEHLEESIAQFEQDADELNMVFDSPLGRMAMKFPGLQTEMNSASRLVKLASECSESLLRPFAELQKNYPLSQLKLNGGYNVTLIYAYLDFAQEKIPEVEALIETLKEVDLGRFDREGKIEGFRVKLEAVVDAYRKNERYIPLVRAFLGNGEDRLYFFAAQNSSEIRSSGGFPGSVGTVRIQDGILRIGKFGTVTGVLSHSNSADTNLSYTEVILSNGWMENGPRDADFSPDFERVAEIWSIGYRDQNGVMPDGVISATPAIIQRLLGVLGEIELSDGTILNGDNAVRALEYDLYYRYMYAYSDTTEGNEITDALFSETVEKLIGKLSFHGDFAQAQALVSVLEESAADRTLMLWLRDEEEQQLVRELGFACTLNRDPSRPEAGVYFSLTNPSRMGWFLDMETEAEELSSNEDGSKTYLISVTLTNTMTPEELKNASGYISGSVYRGFVTGYLYLFAPAGGSVGEVDTPDWRASFHYTEYRGHELAYTHGIRLYLGDSITFRYTMTTAPGEQEPLVFSMTPTLQNFR